MSVRYRVEEVLDELGIEVLGEKNEELVAHCPGHLKRTGSQDRHPSWSINVDTGEHHCFSCGYGGTLAGLVATVQKTKSTKAKQWLDRYATESLEVAHRLVVDVPFPTGPTVLDETELGRFTSPPRWALKARQIRSGATRSLGVLWDPQREAWVTPIRSPETAVLWGWQLKGQTSRLFRNLPPGVPKNDAVFGLAESMDTVVLVESPLDAVRLRGLGIDAVSSFGAYVSDVQMQHILRRAEGLVVALDNPHIDAAGRTAALRILQDYGHYGIWFWPYAPDDPKDPGDMTNRQIYRAMGHLRHSVRGKRAVLEAA